MYDGGYYLVSGDFIRAGYHKHTAELTQPFGSETIRAINILQATPWRINTAVLDVMREAWVAGSTIGDIPPSDLQPLTRIPDDVWEEMSKEAKAAHKARLTAIHGENIHQESRRYSWLAKLDMATQLAAEPALWFPYFCDFRGRLYPDVSDLSPQSDDAGKALLMFARGKPLGDMGMFWLCVRAANCWGQDGVDKLSLEDRVGWAAKNHDRIIEAADSPIDGTRWWAEAEEPWSFLATCFEIKEAFACRNVEEFVSHLPIPLDGACNGLQHLSAMGRDEVGARATNVVPSDVRRDIYSEVAAIVTRMVTEDAGAGDELAKQWLGKVTRKVVKRAVMTTPYGVTERGIGRQLLVDHHTDDAAAANYLKDRIVTALEETIVSAKQIMAWLQEVAGELAEHDIPFRFRTPTGNEVQQSYWDLFRKEVKTLGPTIIIHQEEKAAGLRKRKQRLAAAPNVIHSFDAAHLCRTVNACDDLGIMDFAMIHDSYGVHAADTDVLSHVLREEFARIYETNWLQAIEDCVRSYAPQVEIPSWTEFVTLGDLDVSQVMGAPFFFA